MNLKMKQDIRNIPFHGNPDDASCGQCVYKMMLEYFMPEDNWPFARMNQICGAVPGKYTWIYSPVVALNRLGLETVVYNNFDTVQFIENPENYLLKQYGQQGMEDNITHSDIPATLAQAREYLVLMKQGNINEHQKSITPGILRSFLQDGWLLCLWVNAYKMNNRPGYSGHFVLLHDFDEKGFYLHDPGGITVPHIPNRYVTDHDLIDAASPITYGETAEVIAVRKNHA